MYFLEKALGTICFSLFATDSPNITCKNVLLFNKGLNWIKFIKWNLPSIIHVSFQINNRSSKTTRTLTLIFLIAVLCLSGEVNPLTSLHATCVILDDATPVFLGVLIRTPQTPLFWWLGLSHRSGRLYSYLICLEVQGEVVEGGH